MFHITNNFKLLMQDMVLYWMQNFDTIKML